MSGTDRHPPAVRDRLVRLVVVVAVLTGLVLTLGLQCTDGMSTGMHTSLGTSTALDTRSHGGDFAVDARAAVAHADLLASPMTGSSDSRDTGGLLATCLAFIIAVAAAVVVLRPTGWATTVRLLDTMRGAVVRAVVPWAPSLAQLCVLRT
jgi:hypothetical protein